MIVDKIRTEGSANALWKPSNPACLVSV